MNMISRLRSSRYWNAGLVLAVDLFVSLLSTLVASLLVGQFMPVPMFPLVWLGPWLLASVVAGWVSFRMFRTYRSVIRHSLVREFWKFGAAVSMKELLLLALCLLAVSHVRSSNAAVMYFVLDFLITLSALVALRVMLVVVYQYSRGQNSRHEAARLLIFGTDDEQVALASSLEHVAAWRVRGFLVFGPLRKHQTLVGLPIFYIDDEEDLRRLSAYIGFDAVLFSSAASVRSEGERLVRYCRHSGFRVLVVPPIDELGKKRISLPQQGIREVRIEDLLGRPEIRISMDEIVANFRDKVVMVTGAAGSIGSELCRQLATFGIRRLVLFDNAETPMHNLRLELEERFPGLDFVPVIGDVRLQPRLDFAFRTYRPQVVFHAAAYKHVPLMEENPCEAVLVNVCGSRNVADFCLRYNVEQMVMISTDKAVNPTNVMGCTKRLAEIYVQSLGQAVEQGTVQGHTKFVTTRFGNVLGSNGSVIPRFREQIEKGGPVTVTHPDITRFFMTIPEACRLVMEAATMTSGNQIFVFDMGQSVKIVNLARRMIELAGLQEGRDIRIEYTGLRPGEKLYEEVLSNSENTLPTRHEKIRIARVREYDYTAAVPLVDRLETLSRQVDIPATIRLMKQAVPEYKSRNSEFEKYDTDTSASAS